MPHSHTDIQADSDLARWLTAVPGPTPAELASGRRNLSMKLAADRSRRSGFRRVSMAPAGLLAAGALFGAFAIGASATGGVGLEGTVQGLLANLGVELPDQAQPHVAGLPERGKPEGVPAGQPASGWTLGASAAPEDVHGGPVSGAVAGAIGASDPGPGLGLAVREAACNAAKDRGTLPAQAQAHGPPNGNPSQDCPPGLQAPQGISASAQSEGAPAGVPPTDPSAGHGNSGSAPPAFPGQGLGSPTVPAPPSDQGPPSGTPGNPVGAPPSGQGSQGSLGPPDSIPSGGPVTPPDPAVPPVPPAPPVTPPQPPVPPAPPGTPPQPPVPPAPPVTPPGPPAGVPGGGNPH